MADIKERLDNLRVHIQEPEFLEGKGLSNEVNIRIFCYDAEDEMVVRQFIEQITTDQTLICNLVECNLYKTYLELCEDIDIMDVTAIQRYLVQYAVGYPIGQPLEIIG